MSATKAESIEITLNGERRTIPAGLHLRALLGELDIAADRVAIEYNRAIVRRPEWETTFVEGGSSIEIVQFVGGG